MFLAVFILFFICNINISLAATEFTSIIDPDSAEGTDYSSLSLWETAIQSDLTATTTLVFSITGHIGTTTDGSTIVGQTSGATGTVLHLASTTNQVMIANISGTLFQSGEVITTGYGTTTLADAGDSAIAVATCRSTGGTADTTAVTVDGWTTSADNYIKIWTDPTDVYGRHNGVWSDGKYRLVAGGGSNNSINIYSYFVKIDGLQIEGQMTDYYGAVVVRATMPIDNQIEISNNIIRRMTGDVHSSRNYISAINMFPGGSLSKVKAWNNIIHGFSWGINARGAVVYVYNNTVVNCYDRGIQADNSGQPIILKNNIVQNTPDGYTTFNGGTFAVSSSNNISSDGSAPGTNSKSSTTVKFLDATNNDFHLHPDDTAALNTGTSTIYKYDIDGTARGASFDIGADEVPVEFVSTICENTSAGGDCADMDYQSLSDWEDAVEVDLSASTTRIFSGSITGTLNENTTVNLCNGATDLNIDGVVVATTSDQIMIDGITGTSTPLNVASSTTWSAEACSGQVNYWTVVGTDDELGASPIAIAKIDGEWVSAATTTLNIHGWTTGYDAYIKIYTTGLARHNGAWDSSAYRIERDSSGDYVKGVMVSEDYVRIDGVQVSITNNDYDYNQAIYYESNNLDYETELYLSNNVIKGDTHSTGPNGVAGIYTNSKSTDSNLMKYYIWNNIIYGFNGGSGTTGSYCANLYGTVYFYNNSLHDCHIGIRASWQEDVLINNVVSSTTDPFYGTFYASSTNNATDISDTPDGSSGTTITNATINFISTASGTEDFHLDLTKDNSDIINAGADLSSDVGLSGITQTDIDGAAMNPDDLGYDIGADEIPAKQYRSVGNDATDLSNASTVTISSTTRTATFSVAQPDNIGVGDVIQYGNSGAYQLAFIISRASSTEYGVQAWDTKAPSATTTAAMEIFRAHLLLDDWDDQVEGDVNDTIDNTVSDQVLVNQDLIASNTIMMAAAYASTNGDTGGVTIDAWITGEQNYIKVYTPVSSSEVGVTQRHSGVWDNDKYNIISNSANSISANDHSVWIDGLQVYNTSTASGIRCINFSGSEVEFARISNNIVKSDPLVTSGMWRNGIAIWAVTKAGKGYVWNNIAYGMMGSTAIIGGAGAGINTVDIDFEYFVYNNTSYNNDRGFVNGGVNTVSFNNLSYNNIDNYGVYGGSSSFDSSSSNNLSGPSQTDAPGSFAQQAASPKFIDASNHNYHLHPNDAAAIDKGTTTSSTIIDNLEYDIDGNYRRQFDIGADEASIDFVTTIEESGNGDFTTLASWEDGVDSDLAATTTAVFSITSDTGTFTPNNIFIGQTSNATGTLIQMGSSSDQVLLVDIQGTFISGEEISDGFGTTTLSDAGNPANAVAKIDGAWTGADTTAVTITDWTTGPNNYIRIYTTDTARHQGVWGDSKYQLYANNLTILTISEKFITIDGLQIDGADTSYDIGVNIGGTANDEGVIVVKNNIVRGNGGTGNTGIRAHNGAEGGKMLIYNNIVYDFNGVDNYCINNGDGTGDVRIVGYFYNNTVDNCTVGISKGSQGMLVYAKNNIAQNCGDLCYGENYEYYYSGSTNNIASDHTAPGTDSMTTTSVSFLDIANNDFRLSPNDTTAKNAGTSTPMNTSGDMIYDIQGTMRGASWDIGADELTTEYISTICENTSAGGDCTDLDYQTLASWEDAVEVDLTATTTRIFSGSITGVLAENNTVTLYESGAITSITALVVATTSDQILLDNINTGNASSTNAVVVNGQLLSVASSSQWRLNSSNYFTVTGTDDDLGASPIAIAKIDGAWTGADTTRLDVNDWTTDIDNTIKIYTTSLARHTGIWDETKYIIKTDAEAIDINEPYLIMDGLQVYNTGSLTWSAGINVDPGVVSGWIEISNNIIKADTGVSNSGLLKFTNHTEARAYNNIIYSLGGYAGNALSIDETGSKTYVYNNTIFNVDDGIYAINGDVIIVNNLFASTTNPFTGAFHASSTNNASDTTDTPTGGSNTIINATINFVNTASGTEDFHLTEDNGDVIDAGVDMSCAVETHCNASLQYDIDGSVRVASSSQEVAGWDIGADEVNERTATSTGRWTATSTWSGGYIPRSWETVTIPAGLDVTYDPGNLFQDDFEEGTFSDWSGASSESGNSITIDSAEYYAGDYSAKYVFGGTSGSNINYWDKNLSNNYENLYYRANIFIESDSLSNAEETNFIEFARSDSDAVGIVSVYKNGSILELKASYHNGTALVDLPINKQISTSTWYTVEYYHKTGAGDGEIYFWVNGREIASTTGLTNDSNDVNRIYSGQSDRGTNDEAITYYLDDIALDSEYQIGHRSAATSSERTTALDHNVSDITIADTATLSTGAVIDADYSYRYPLWVYGDINVDGTLDQNGKSEIKLKCDTTVEYGVIVGATGKLDVDGTSRVKQDAVIGAVVEQSANRTYINCSGGSECYFKYADISYMGGGAVSAKYGIYSSADNSVSNEGFSMTGSVIHNSQYGLMSYDGSLQVIDDNVFYSNGTAVRFNYSGTNIVKGNTIYSGTTGIQIGGGYNLVQDNIIIDSDYYSIAIDNASSNYIYNNTIVGSYYNGVTNAVNVSGSNNIFKNNNIAYNYDDISDSGSGNNIDNNLFYGNTQSTGTGTNAIESDPLFYNFDNSPSGNDTGGTERSVSSATTNTLTASSPSWDTDEWKGYTVWADDDFSSATGGQFRYILSNTTDTLTIASTWDSTPTASYEFKIIDFTLSADSPALGSGATTTPNTTAGEINIGAITDYAYSVDDTKAYNSMQLAHDNDSTGAGDTITTYTKDLLSDVINGSVTSVGNGFYSFTIDENITQNDAYNGYYLYITAGADRGKYYLITDTASSTDTLYIFDSELSASLEDNDEFTVVDRVYDRVGYKDDYFTAIVELNKSGTVTDPITWNTSGNVIIDAKDLDDSLGTAGFVSRWGAFQYNVIDGFVIMNGERGIGGNNANYNTISNNKFYNISDGGVYSIGFAVITNNEFYNVSDDDITACENSVISGNTIMGRGGSYAVAGNSDSLIFNNSIFGMSDAVVNTWGDDNMSIVKNNIFANSNVAIGVRREAYNNKILNNTIVDSPYGIFLDESSGLSPASTTVQNNILYKQSIRSLWVDPLVATTSNDFNFYYNNGTDYDGPDSIGASSVVGTDPNFKSVDTGTADTNSTSTIIIDAGQNWTANEFVGYGVKITISSTEYWAGVTSNTEDRLYLAPALDAIPTNGDVFIITDFSITGTTTATTTPLGNGASADGTTESGHVNMGAITDFSKNITDDMVFNSMQDAHDDAGLSAGDTVTTYAVNEVENGVTGTSTDLGPMIKVEVNESAITEDNQYEGMYFYIEAGENRGRHYLIVDSDESSTATDTVTLLIDSTDGFNKNDSFTVVDRIYDRVGKRGTYNYSDNATVVTHFTKDGTADNPISYNILGKVIIDGKDEHMYDFYIENTHYSIFDGFIIKNAIDDGVGRPTDDGGGNTFRNLTVCDNGDMGIYFDRGSNNLAENNIVYRNVGDGITLAGVNRKNIVFSNGYQLENKTGIRSYTYQLTSGNTIFGNWRLGSGLHDYSVIRGNTMIKNYDDGVASNYTGDFGKVLNNTILEKTYVAGAGVDVTGASDDNIEVKNNIFMNLGNGIEDNSGTTDYNFNFYYNNTEDIDGGGTIGTSSITGYDPNFINLVSSTVDANSTTTNIIDATKSWTPNQWVGYGFKITISGTDYWAGITSNTSDRLYLAPALDTLPIAGDAYIITDFSITATSTTASTTPLGWGVGADGLTVPGTVNMGAQLGYTYNANINSGTKYNSIQAAHDDSSLSSGDNVLVYAVDELTTGTIGTTTDLGPMIELAVDEAAVTSDNDYAGMYMYMLTGTNQYDHYLIARTDEATPDTITIVTDITSSTFSNGDTFRIIDRVYNQISNPVTPTSPNANISITKSGTSLADRIEFSSNGTVIIDAYNPIASNFQFPITDFDYNISDANGTVFVTLNNFQLANADNWAVEGNNTYETEGAGAETDYCFPNCNDTATEFVAVVDPGNGAGTDFTSLAAWEQAVQVDLTSPNTMVFSVTNATGTFPIDVTVVGQSSGATASSTLLATSSSQMLLHNITPYQGNTFQVGELVYIQGQATTTANATLADNGNMAIAVAKCRTTDGSADDSIFHINGWTTSADNYIKIWTDPTDVYGRHNGVWSDEKYHIESDGNNLNIEEYNVYVDGIQFYVTNNSSASRHIISINPAGLGETNSYISNNIFRFINAGVNTRTGININSVGAAGSSIYIYNNIFYGAGTGSTNMRAISHVYNSDPNLYVYNNTISNFYYGIYADYSIEAKNNITQDCTDGFYHSGSWNAGTGNNISDVASDAPGTNSATGTVKFLDATNNNFHLHPDDTAALNTGTTTIYKYDIDGTARGNAFDIGADELPVEFVSTICENTSAGGDCADMDYSSLSDWEDAVEVDLSASTTRIFSGSITGTLNENTTVNLCDGSTDLNIDGVVVATTSDSSQGGLAQIMIDGITGTTTPLNVASSTTWSAEACSGQVNYWTVTGTDDDLGASPIAIAKIDGAWSGADNILDITGWTTDTDNYIKIYTTDTARHHGKWSDTDYRISVTNTGSNALPGVVNRESYVIVDGLQVDYSHNSTSIYGHGMRLTTGLNNTIDSDIVFSNNIVHGNILNGLAKGIVALDSSARTKILNNIIYGFNLDNGGGYGECIIVTGNNSYAYNNTVHNCSIGIGRRDDYPIIKNNLIASTTNPFNGTFHASSTNNATDGTDTPTGGSNTITNATINFISTASGTEDLHLDIIKNNSDLVNAGADLSSDIGLSGITQTDIDGAGMNPDDLGYDIGADEIPAKQYRSVGNDATDLSTTATVTISSTTRTATFSAAQPDNIGVGDVIQYGNSGAYKLAFIISRASSTEYGVQAWDTKAPSATTTADMEIFRAHLELNDWEDQIEVDVNDAIDDTVSNQVLVNTDLVASNTTMIVAAYASDSGDDVAVSIDDWTTGAQNYIKIYTPVNSSEVGISQRHSGVWDDNKYYLEAINSNVIRNTEDVIIDGLQINLISNTDDNYGIILTYYMDNFQVVSNNIIKATLSGSASDNIAIYLNSFNTNRLTYIYNNIIYDFANDSYANNGLYLWSNTPKYVYNNTVYNSYRAINNVNSSNSIYYNNILNNCMDECFANTGGSPSGSNNITSDGTYIGTDYQSNTTVKFVDATNKNFHLHPSDTTAIDAGTSTVTSIIADTSYDIDGNYRRQFDIGADEASIDFVTTIEESGNGDFTTLASWEDGVDSDLAATTTAVFLTTGKTGTFTPNNIFIGQTSNATGTLIQIGSSSDQVLLTNIQGTFISGEDISDGNGTTTLADAGNPANAVAKIDGAWSGADTTAVTITDWTTGPNNYIRIYTTDTARHQGVWSDGKYRLVTTGYLLELSETYTQVFGLQLNPTTSWDIGIRAGQASNTIIGDCIAKGNGSDNSEGFIITNDSYIFNNIAYGFSGTNGAGFNGSASTETISIYNCLAYDNETGFESAYGDTTYYNVVSFGNTDDFQAGGCDIYNSASDDADSSIHPSNWSTVFEDYQNHNFSLKQTDTDLRNAGTSTPMNTSGDMIYDIQGTMRGASWDIGADELTTEYVSTICENTSAGGDCADLDYQSLSDWENAVEVDLTATTTRIFSGSITGALAENNTVTLYESGAITSITALVVATTSDQILLDNINTGDASSTNAVVVNGQLLSVGSGSVWQFDASNYWTVTGTDDDLGASPIAIAKIDGAWASADTQAVTIDHWTSDNDNYIKIYTTDLARHDGKWNDTKYRMDVSAGTANVFNYEDYFRAEGLQLAGSIRSFRDASGYGEVHFVSNLVNGPDDDYLDAVFLAGTSPTYNIINNIIYHTIGAEGVGIYLGDAGTAYVYNNTLVNNTVGINSGNNFVLARNNAVYGSGNMYSYVGTFVAGTDYNATDGTDAIGTGANNIISATMNFVNIASGTEDLHLDTTKNNSDLINSGFNISASTSLFASDIDGALRNSDDLGYDIGADEIPAKQYRSVGNDATDLSTTATVTISSTTRTATFSAAQPDNIGVGDVIQYGNAGAYQLAFIISRASSTEYGVQSWDTKAPTATTTAAMEIFRAHLLLDDWEDQLVAQVNSGIDSTVETQVLVNQDLVASNTTMMVAAYASDSGDNVAVEINSWDTGIQNYIKVYTPVYNDEVGVTQRHNGVWDDDKYSIIHKRTVMIIFENNVIVDGLQVKFNTSNDTYERGLIANVDQADGYVTISNNIVDGSNYYGTGNTGIGSYTSSLGPVNILNNLIYNTSYGLSISPPISQPNYILNNTVYNNSDYGYWIREGDESIFQNNLAQNCTEICFHVNSGGWTSDDDYNISSDATAPGANSKTDTSVKFIDETNKNFHLHPDDTVAIDAGTSTVAETSLMDVSTDIDGHYRTSFDIGADEASIEFISMVEEAGSGDSYSTLAAWETANQTDLTASTTRVFSITGLVGTVGDGATVVGATSNATGTVVHVSTTTNQILLQNITGDFSADEQLQVDGSNYVTISNLGNPAHSVARINGDWSSEDSGGVIVGWGTGQNNYIKIYTTDTARHNGKWNDSKYRLNKTSDTTIRISENNVIIDGLQMVSNYSGIYSSSPIQKIENLVISNNIIKYTGSGMSHGIQINCWEYMRDIYIFNNIIYNFSGSGITFDISDDENINIYNNTLYNNNNYGIYSSRIGLNLNNNIVQNSGSADYHYGSGGPLAVSSNNISSDGTAPGTESKTNTTVNFVDADNDDFHLDVTDTTAKDAGINLSSESVFSANTSNDIEGHSRHDVAWDIGADEAPTVIYRSVGRHANDLNVGSATVTVSTATNTASAIFSSALADNIGVGDAIEYGTPATLAFITGRTSSTTYSVQSATGSPAIATSSASASIYRVHEFLDDWEDQVDADVNANIHADVRGSVLVTQDLVASNTAIFVATYASTSADTLAVDVNGWTTGTSSYIKIYTPTELAEVGESQRHSGIWSDSAYRLDYTLTNNYQIALSVKEDYFRAEGLQISLTNSTYVDGRTVALVDGYINPTNEAQIYNNIIKGIIGGTSYNYGMVSEDLDSVVKFYNNIVYGFDSTHSGTAGVYVNGNVELYNNTVFANNRGLARTGSGSVTAKNNVSFNNVNDFDGSFTTIDYNASDDGDGTNAISLASSTAMWAATFTDYANGDFSIRDMASVLYNSGTTIITVTEDIIGTARPYYEHYDIGAFEFSSTKPKYRFSPGGTFKFEGDFKFQ